MKEKKSVLLPKTRKVLEVLGTNIKLARLRRKLSTEQVSERADVTRMTLWSIEKGAPSVTIGKYIQVLLVLGLENDLIMVANDDKLGHKLTDAELLVKQRAPKKIKNKTS